MLGIKHASIVLNSRGGYIQDAIAIGGLVRSPPKPTLCPPSRLQGGSATGDALKGKVQLAQVGMRQQKKLTVPTLDERIDALREEIDAVIADHARRR